MNRCPITYEPLEEGVDYSAAGLRRLDRNLRSLARLEQTGEQQRQEAMRCAGKTSLPGVEPKLSAVLRVTQGRFEVVDRGGRYILKPPPADHPELPANEDVTMRMAAAAGIEVPLHGLLRAADGSLTYFIKRFDRPGHRRLPVEDFAQLSGVSHETRYSGSMELVAGVVERFCTFPVLDRIRLFERTLFSFLVGNENMHMKNFSLLTRGDVVELAPAYDFLSTTLALPNPQEEFALPLRGKKSNLTRSDLFRYFARERLQLNDAALAGVVTRFREALPQWGGLIERSFLSPALQGRFRALLESRARRCLT
jgi:serine/threonine-protein kinase HipA